MRFTLLLTALAGLAAMTGCAPTVAIHPLYTTPDLVSDLPLEGNWAGNDGEAWQIKKSEDGYEADSADGSKYTFHLLRLKESEFVDVTGKSGPGIGVAGHLIGKISIHLAERSLAETHDRRRSGATIHHRRGAADRPDCPHQRVAAVHPDVCRRPGRLGR
jgi:hypothetical protein